MVSPISAKLLAGTRKDSPLTERLLLAAASRNGDASSQGSNASRTSKHSHHSRHSHSSRVSYKKRSVTGALKNAPFSINGAISGAADKIASSVTGSGYSGDLEDTSVNPPVFSIDFQGRHKRHPSPTGSGSGRHINLHCPKRQKLNEQNFAASTVKDDLKRASMEFKEFNRDAEETTSPGVEKFTIKLKGVRLIHSSEVMAPLVNSKVSEKSTATDYEALSHAVSDFYPSSATGGLQSFEPSQETQEDNASSDSRSTSSVSDTESDSGSDNNNNNNGLNNNQILLIPPRVEDSLDATKMKKLRKVEPMSTCNVISCASNATTMTESLQLSTEPRIVTLSSSPYSIIHANAAFMRLSGKEDARNILGTSFTNFLDPNANASGDSINLTNCMVSSSMGNDSKLFLLPKNVDDDGENPVECSIRVSPIVARKTESKEMTTISHFAIELFESSIRNGDGQVDIRRDSLPNSPVSAPIGVMG